MKALSRSLIRSLTSEVLMFFKTSEKLKKNVILYLLAVTK